ncbi:MAG: hypothetical protein GEU98_19010 [Pseudonocardiaceae bacterium]|nr:hypothetical protein [Pseudonocardiaceae bacterium]
MMNEPFDGRSQYYGMMPPDPWGDGLKPRPPESLAWAWWAGIASAVCGLLGVVLARVFISDQELGQLRSAFAQQGQRMTLAQLRDTFESVWIVALVIAVLLSAMWLTFLYFAYQGRNWARITVTVLAAIWLVLSIPSVTGGVSGVTMLVSLVQVVALVGVLVALNRRTTRDYFRQLRS